MSRTIQPNDLVNVGKLYRGFTWEYAIRDAIKTFRMPIQPIHRAVNPDKLLDDAKVFSHYELTIRDKGRLFKTRIPTSLSEYVKTMLDRARK